LHDLENMGIDLDRVAWQLQNEGAQKFSDPYDALMKPIAAKRQQFLGANAALSRKQQRVIRIHLGSDIAGGLKRMAESFP
jgi:hypothetical protein